MFYLRFVGQARYDSNEDFVLEWVKKQIEKELKVSTKPCDTFIMTDRSQALTTSYTKVLYPRQWDVLYKSENS